MNETCQNARLESDYPQTEGCWPMGIRRFAIPEYALIGSFIAIGMAVAEYALTVGTSFQPVSAMCHALGLALFLINFPSMLSAHIGRHRTAIDVCIAVLLVSALVVLVWKPQHPSLAWLLAGSGVICFLLSFYAALIVDRKQALLSTAWSILYCLVVGQLVWAAGFRNPLDLLLLASTGTTHTDPAYHNAVIAMLKTHNVCSTGLDGPVSFTYHYAAHLIAAKVGLLLNVSPQVVTTIVMPTIFPGMLVCWSLRFLSILQVCIRSESHGVSLSSVPHMLVLTGLGGFLPFHILEGTFISWNYSFSMDSQILGLVVATMAVCLLLKSHIEADLQSCRASISFPVWSVLLAAAAIALLAMTKVTIAHLFTLGFLFITWRSRERQRFDRIVASAVAIFTLGVCSMLTQVKVNSNSLFFSPFGLWVDRVPLQAWSWCVPVNTCFALIYAWFRLRRMDLLTLRDGLSMITNRRALDVELVLLLAFTGTILTTVFGGPWAFNSIYYQSTVQFFSVFCAAAVVSQYVPAGGINRLLDLSIHRSALLIVLLVCLSTALTNSLLKWKDVVWLNVQSRGSHFAIPLGMSADGNRPELRVMLRQGQVRRTMQLITANTEYIETQMGTGERDVLGALLRLNTDLPFSEKQKSLLWIPRTNREFWDMAPKNRRWMLPLFAVGLTELAMVDGLPEELEPTGGGFGFAAYSATTTDNESALNLSEVLQRTRSLGFSQVIELPDTGRWIIHSVD